MLSVSNIFAGEFEEVVTEAEGTTIDMGTENKGQKGKLDGNVQSALDQVLKTSLNVASTTDGIPNTNSWAKSSPGATNTKVDNSISQENVKF
jgi:hypothetical protein